MSAHKPTEEGPNKETIGTTGLAGSCRLIVNEGIVNCGLQFETNVQSFANIPPLTVTEAPYSTDDETGYMYNSDGDCQAQAAVFELTNLSKASQVKRPLKFKIAPLPRLVGESKTS
jgi:hypothetical protein